MSELRKYIRNVLLESVGDQIGAVYCDMDGVLAHFEVGSVNNINAVLDAAAVDPEWTHSSKKIRAAVRRVHRDLGPEYRVQLGDDLRAEKGIKSLSYGLVGLDPGTFFRDLPPHADGISVLWPFLHSLGKPVHILSAPISGNGEGGTAEDGKTDWVGDKLNPSPASIIITPAAAKQAYAINESTGMPNLLVDDKPATIQQWNALGGIGILHIPGDSAGSIAQIQERLGV